MLDQPTDRDDLLNLTSEIVSAHVRSNSVPVSDLAGLIQNVHSTLTGLGQPAAEPKPEQQPAVNPKRSVTDDYIVCLDCGKKQKTLKRHIAVAHGMIPAEYRAKWSLPHGYPMVAPSYARTRQDLAKQIGLGRKPKVVAAAAKPRAKRSKAPA